MIDAIVLWGSVLMIGIGVMVFGLVMDWRERRYSEKKQQPNYTKLAQ